MQLEVSVASAAGEAGEVGEADEARLKTGVGAIACNLMAGSGAGGSSPVSSNQGIG